MVNSLFRWFQNRRYRLLQFEYLSGGFKTVALGFFICKTYSNTFKSTVIGFGLFLLEMIYYSAAIGFVLFLLNDLFPNFLVKTSPKTAK